MKRRHLLFIALAIFAIIYTTTDRLNDASEAIPSLQILHADTIGFDTNHGDTSPSHDELFCDFPMLAKIISTIAVILMLTLVSIELTKVRITFYHQEQFRPPAAIIV